MTTFSLTCLGLSNNSTAGHPGGSEATACLVIVARFYIS